VLAAAPLALIGALIGLLVSGWPLGFMPMLGIVSLVGVVINNAIILIDFIQGAVAGGTPLREAVKQAGIARMKPILLTTLTTVGGMVPLALFGGPMWAGMSYAMIFGLVFSTGLTLLVIPTIYVTFVEWFKMQVNQEEVV
jgi:multidrug efflux pump subunit AcrB